jgi:hypothetical protein
VTGIRLLPDSTVRSKCYFVARTSARCWHCGQSTRLLALALPPSHETLNSDARIDAEERVVVAADVWQRANANAFVFYVGHLLDGVQNRLQQLSPHFRLAPSAAASGGYWANHCEHCDALLDDHDLHCEFDSAFMPSNEDAAAKIDLLRVREPFEAAAAGYAIEPEFFRFMRVC